MNAPVKNACVLFAEICGSGKLYEKLGDTEALRAVERCVNRMERASSGYKGRVVKTLGDELMVVFDSAEEALHAAVEMQQRINSLPPASGVTLAVRIGCHFGHSPEDDNDAFVNTVNVAARAVMVAKPGQVLATVQAVEQLPPGLRELVKEIELPATVKDEGLRLFEVTWAHGDDLKARLAAIAPPPAAAPAGPSKVRLKLRHGDDRIVLGPDRPIATLGRDVKADIVVKDARASRNHGRIERRFDKFVLIDQSTNGTYVTMRGEAEFMLRQEETMLRGRGKICFGHSGDSAGEQVEFEILD
jgi:adenylate cyclase